MTMTQAVTGQLVFLLGEPGAGKSTLLRAYLHERYTVLPERYQPILHTPLTSPCGDAIVLGRLDGEYPGADALPHDAEAAALRLLASRPAPRVYAEGLRLATETFWRGAAERGYAPLIIWLSVPPHVAEARIQQRQRGLGDAADAIWRARQRRQTPRLGRRHATAVLNGRDSLPTLAQQMAAIIDHAYDAT